MIIYKEAKQVGTLYHCTDVRGLYGIIKNNVLNPSSNGSISFARSRDSKINFIVRICIDGDKLSNKKKIYPYQDPDWYEDEMEERVDGSISNIKNYILMIDINSDSILDEFPTQNFKNYDEFESFLEKNNMKYRLL